MSEQYLLISECLGRKEIGITDRSFIEQLLGQKLVFDHRKSMTFWQRVLVYRTKSNLEHKSYLTKVMSPTICCICPAMFTSMA